MSNPAKALANLANCTRQRILAISHLLSPQFAAIAFIPATAMSSDSKISVAFVCLGNM